MDERGESQLYYAVYYGREWHWVHFRTKSDGPEYAYTMEEAERIIWATTLFVKLQQS